MMHNRLFIEQAKPVIGLAPVVPASAAPRWVSLKNYERLTVLLSVLNGTTVTGAAIGLSQAKAVAGTDAKVLPFARGWRQLNAAAGDDMVEFAVSSNSFTTDATNNRQLLYVIEVDPNQLDVANGFDCARVTVGNATAATVSALYLLGPARFSRMPTAIAD